MSSDRTDLECFIALRKDCYDDATTSRHNTTSAQQTIDIELQQTYIYANLKNLT